MIDWYWFTLLLPIASYSGFVLGRRGSERSSGERVNQLSKQYFQGLNHLLNDQSDQAIALFERIADDDNDRFETQLALGNLFRRRGELDRAMKLHQDLSVRPMLATEQRALALLELGDDFIRAGLLDRAEALFDELLQIDAQSIPALKHLIGIYEQEREWQKAIEAALRYQSLSSESMAKLLGHYACELAELADKKKLATERDRYLDLALQYDPAGVRPLMLAANRAIVAQNAEAARAALIKIMEGDAAYVVDLMPLISKLSVLHHGYADELFSQAVELDRGSSAVLGYAEHLARTSRAQAAQLLRKRLEGKPSARVLQQWLALCDFHDVPEATRHVIADGLKQVTQVQLSHRCSVCGFGARQLHWNCPSCKSWSSIKPLVLP